MCIPRILALGTHSISIPLITMGSKELFAVLKVIRSSLHFASLSWNLSSAALVTKVSTAVGVVYHPPSACDRLMSEYLHESLSSIEARLPDSGLLLVGDFNKLDLSYVKNAHGLKQIVPFPTRGSSMLDLVFTNLGAFYEVPIKRPNFGLSDHDTVEVKPLARSDFPKNKIVIKSRDLRTTKRLAIRKYLEEVDLGLLVGTKVSCEEKTNTLEFAIKLGMDTLLPLRSKKLSINDPPWINEQLKSMIRERQRALARGDDANFRRLRNSVNRLRKLCRAKYYASNVEQLRDCEPRRWWKEVKKLAGMQVPTRTDTISVLRNIDQGPFLNSTATHAQLISRNEIDVQCTIRASASAQKIFSRTELSNIDSVKIFPSRIFTAMWSMPDPNNTARAI